MEESKEKPNNLESGTPQSSFEEKLKEIEEETGEGIEGILNPPPGPAFKEEINKLTAPGADEEISEELNKMGSIEEVEERRRVEEETEAMNRELDEIGRTSVAKAYWRNRQKIWSQAIAEEIEKEIEAGALDPEKPAEEINLSKKNISNHLEEFIEEGIIDSDLPAKEIPKVLRSYITSLERREEEENK